MKNIKFLASVVLLAATVTVFAQGAGPVGGQATNDAPKAKGVHAGPKEQAMIRKSIYPNLNLTADQQTKIDALETKLASDLRNMAKELKGLKGNDDAKNKDEVVEKVKAKRKEIAKNFTQDLRGILNQDQFKKFIDLYKEDMKKLRDKAKDGGASKSDKPGGSQSGL